MGSNDMVRPVHQDAVRAILPCQGDVEERTTSSLESREGGPAVPSERSARARGHPSKAGEESEVSEQPRATREQAPTKWSSSTAPKVSLL